MNQVKIRITVQSLRSKDSWPEEYSAPENNPQGWAESLIKRFNDSCRPGESKRKLISVEVLGASTEHRWYKRTDGMSVHFRGNLVDIMECSACGVTGKRFGIQGGIKRDSKYRAKKYAVCGGVLRHGGAEEE